MDNVVIDGCREELDQLLFDEVKLAVDLVEGS